MVVWALILVCISAIAAKQIGSIDKIVGGDETEPLQYKDVQAYLTRSNSFTCGADILGGPWILTAGHCILSGSASDYKVTVNLHSRNNPSSTNAQVYNVDSITNHPNYDSGPGFVPNDIAVIKLTSSVSGVNPIALAQGNYNFAGDTCHIAGWGRTYGGGPTSNVLRHAQGTVLTTNQCQNYFGSSATGLNICLGNSTASACNGDSGGPMVCVENGQEVLAGVTSFGHSGCPATSPSAYTRVSSYYDWVDQTTDYYISTRSTVAPTQAPSPTPTPAPTPAPTQPPAPGATTGRSIDTPAGTP